MAHDVPPGATRADPTVPDEADVVVIGGGPAGSTAANLLASRGWHVVLLERARHPRPVVGESILPLVWKYADLLGATAALEAEDFLAKAGGTALWNGTARQMTFADFGYRRPALHVERDRFDEILLRTAQDRGARVFEERAVLSVDSSDDGSLVRYRDVRSGSEGAVRCRRVVDASGQSAVIARQLGFREFDRDLRFMSVWGYFGRSAYVSLGGEILPFEDRRTVPPTTLASQLDAGSWCWHIVQREAVSVGLVLPPAAMADLKRRGEDLESSFRKRCAEAPLVSDLLDHDSYIPGTTSAIRDFAYYPRRLSGPGWFLAGDAVAFVDPINSNGVMGAFYTGYLAGLAVDECLHHPGRTESVRERFDASLRGCMALYRLAAVAPGTNSYPDMHAHALPFLKHLGPTERELLHVQMQLVRRTENLEPLYELDRSLPHLRSDRARTVEITPPTRGAAAP